MSTTQSFASVFDMTSSDGNESRSNSINKTDYVSEETRNAQAYREYQHELRGSYQPDHRLEAEFFGHRRLSISDFDGTRTIVNPVCEPLFKPYAMINENATGQKIINRLRDVKPAVTSLDGNKTTDIIVASTPYCAFDNPHFDYDYEYPPCSLIEGFTGPHYGANDFRFDHPPTTAEMLQKSTEESKLLLSPTSPSPLMRPRNNSLVSDKSLNESLGENYQYSDVDARELEEQSDSQTPSEYGGERPDKHAFMFPASLRRFFPAECDPECASIQGSGSIHCPIVIEDDATERAFLTSNSVDIVNVSTPELAQDHNIDDVDSGSTIEFAYDASPSTLHFFNQAGVNVTTRDLQEDFVAAQATKLAGGYLDIDQAAETEKDRLNVDFFEHSSPNKTRSIDSSQRCLVSDLIDDLANSDHYFGPGVPPRDDSICEKMRNASTTSDQVAANLVDNKRQSNLRLNEVLFNDSSQLKGCRNQESSRGSQNFDEALQATVSGQVPECNAASSLYDFSASCAVDRESLRATEVSRMLNYGRYVQNKKRVARASFGIIELSGESAERYFSSKKPRLGTSSTSQSVSLPSTPLSTISSISACSPMATALKGYAGQFELRLPDFFGHVKQDTGKHVFGNHLHANGEIVNLRFIADRSTPASDLSDSPGIRTIIEQANLHHAFAEEMYRNSDEEDLRREAHRECTAARLEGVPVGYYRYFAGHMTIEEYVDARMCVCWERCFCSKICTRFGDLVCPCADSLLVGDDA